MKILCVDDEERVQILLKNLLEILDYDVETASNGLDALEKINHFEPDIIVSDVRMPKMNGIELLEKIKELKYRCEVIIVSAHNDIDHAIASLRLGAADYVRKPLDARELTHMINRLKEKIELEREVRNYRENLERLVEEKSQKLLEAERYAILGRHSAHLAHNLNSSLTGVLGCVQLLDITLEDKAKTTQKYINTIQESALKMKDTIGNTLLRVRKDHNLNKVEIDLNDVIEGQIKLFQTHSVVDKEVEFCREFDVNLPRVLGVYSDFSQIYDNFLSNAIDALETSEIKKITLNTSFNKNEIILKINDTGCGIPVKICEEIFNPHFTTKEIGKGTGLGLASAKELLDHYNADVSVESTENEYTTFTIKIPLAR